MAPTTQLRDLPNEILDKIFQHLHGEYQALNVFLLNQGTNSSATTALWYNVDLSIRKTYRQDPVWQAGKYACHYKPLLRMRERQPATVFSLKIDVPYSKCAKGGCRPPFVQVLLDNLGSYFPKLRKLNIAFLDGAFIHSCHANERPHLIELPPTVRELITNQPDLFRWSNKAGTTLEKLTYSTECIECDNYLGNGRGAHFIRWLDDHLDGKKADSILAGLKAFRFEITASRPCVEGICRGYDSELRANDGFLAAFLHVIKARLQSRLSLERLEVQAPFYYSDHFPQAPAFLDLVDNFPNLKVLQMPVEVLPFVLPTHFTPARNITFEVLVDPRPLALNGQGHQHFNELQHLLQTLANAKVFLDVQQGDKRKIEFVFADSPRKTFRTEDYRKKLYVEGEQALHKWYLDQLGTVRVEKLRPWLQEAPAHLRVLTPMLPSGHAFVDVSIDSLDKWCSANSKPKRRRKGGKKNQKSTRPVNTTST